MQCFFQLRHFLLAAVCLLLLEAPARAQLIDELELRRDGPDAVLQVRLITEIQFLRAAVGRAGDQTQAFYRLLPTRQALNLVTAERRMVAHGDFPGIVVTDESSVGRSGSERRLVLRLDRPLAHKVRAGRGNRSIEFVFAGQAEIAFAQLPSAAAPVPPVAAAAVTVPAADIEAEAAALLDAGRAGLARNDTNAAIDSLSRLLDLPPNRSSREGQALIGQARMAAGDPARARSEFELFLRLYPSGADADQVRAALAALAPAPQLTRDGRSVTPTTTLTGSISSFYYGGQSKVRSQEFQDSPIGGLPELVNLPTLSAVDQSTLVTGVDVNWRHRDAEVDQRFVFRDDTTHDFLNGDKNANKLRSLYFDQRSLSNGTQFRIGRQTPLGGGVMGRFDGVQGSYIVRPRWKLGAVFGVPTDELLDTRRQFYGASIETDAIGGGFGGSLYAIQQTVDGRIDRRALGSEMRYFNGGVSATGQLDYDVVLKALNIASVQGTWQLPDNTVFNVLYDRRTTPMLSLGNALFFSAADPRPTRIDDLLGSNTLAALRDQVVATSAVATQAAFGITTPVSSRWQIGADLRLTNIGELPAVIDILPNGQPGTGNLWSLGLQAIGSNLYSARDTHVLILNLLTGPAFRGQLLSYNNSSQISAAWLLEPSLKLYHQTDTTGISSTRWSPGLRVSYRPRQDVVIESELSYENSSTKRPTGNEYSDRVFYYLGGRYEF
jgi:tetratricopeptide (TPR) repeat protein